MSWNPIDLISKIFKPVSGMYNKRQDRKIQKEAGKAKLAQAKQQGEENVTLTDAEWEAIAVSQNDGTWKDEYLTVAMTSWVLLLFFGSIYGGYTQDYTIVKEVLNSLAELDKAGVDMGHLTEVVVYAGVGLKAWRGVVK